MADLFVSESVVRDLIVCVQGARNRTRIDTMFSKECEAALRQAELAKKRTLSSQKRTTVGRSQLVFPEKLRVIV